VATIEVTYNPQSGRWHPHLHVLFDGRYMPISALRDAWTRSSRGARIVWVERVPDRSRVSRYIAKYVSKVPGSDGWKPAQVREWVAATAGKRFIICSGKCKGVRLKETVPEHDKGPLSHVCYVAHIKTAVTARRPYAILALRILRQTIPMVARIIDPDSVIDVDTIDTHVDYSTFTFESMLRDCDTYHDDHVDPYRWTPPPQPPPPPPPRLPYP
jgi:hypothetical protein